MADLPFIDEHSERTHAPAEAVWSALLRVIRRLTRDGGPVGRLLACDPAQATPEFTGRVGECVTGFRVAGAEPGTRLELRGRHRFAQYSLTFVLADGHIRAQTHAAFPGVAGRLYRAAVIGSGAHRVVTQRILRDVVRAGREQ